MFRWRHPVSVIDVGNQRVDEQGGDEQRVKGNGCRTADERAGGGMYRIPPSGVCVQMYVCTQGTVSGSCLNA